MRTKLFIVCSVLVLALGYPYWQIRSLDPEGGCKEIKHLPLCATAKWDELFGGAPPWHFETLPTDQEMVDNFGKHRDEFDSIVENASSIRVITKTKANDLGVSNYVNFLAVYPQTTEEKKQQRVRFWAYNLEAASTRYVKGSEGTDMSMLLRSKSYVYFVTPPEIKDGELIYADGSPWQQFRLAKSLDGPPWPSDWAERKCWLRQIEPQWFLALCRDQIGG